MSLDAEVFVTDKMDGSLGIMYPTPDGPAIATRGSFASDQAIHATKLLRRKYPEFTLPDGLTLLFEIIFPTNRIVVDYGDMDDLVLLSGMDIETGESFPPELAPWPGPVTELFEYSTLAEALAAPDRPNREGLVVQERETDVRVKLKQEDYVQLHRIVTGLNARSVWERLSEGKPLDELKETLPDEFHGWVRDVARELTATVERGIKEAYAAYVVLVADLPHGWTRKDFAAVAGRHPLSWALFALLDGKDIYPRLWRDAKPEAHWTPAGRRFDEDNA